jgi:ADP-ribosylglycohydrolase
MRYSLLSRFRGTLYGAALGEILGNYCCDRLQAKLPLSNLENGQWAAAPMRSTPSGVSATAAGWGRLALAAAHCLIEGIQSPDACLPREGNANAGIAIAALPIALFFHDDFQQLRRHLAKTTAQCASSPEVCGGVLTVAYAVALALQERLHPPQFIAQVIAELNLAASSPLLAQQLWQVQTYLDRGSGLSAVLASFRVHAANPQQSDILPFVLAFYCHLSTPDATSVAMRRAVAGMSALTSRHAQLAVTTALTGALSGAYNGLSGIPIDWRRQLDRPATHPPLARLWSLTATDRIDQLASHLLASWSGAYHPVPDVQFHSRFVTAAPQSRRAR